MANAKKYTNQIYNNKSTIGEFKGLVTYRSDAPFYFHKSNIRFFGSKMEDVYSNKDNTIYIGRERLRYSNDGNNKYKILMYDSKNQTFYSSDIIDDKEKRDTVFKKLKRGELSKEKAEKLFTGL